MSQKTVRAVLPHLAGLENIDLTGWGEPLLNPEVYENIALLRAYFPGRISLTTNGSLLDERGIVRLIEARVDSICFSLDALDEASYNRWRPGGDFPRLISMLQRFVEAKRAARVSRPLLFATFLVRRSGIDELPRFARWARELGLDGVVFQHLTGVFSAEALSQVAYHNFYVSDFEMKLLAARLAEARALAGEGFIVKLPENILARRVRGCGIFDIRKPFVCASGDVTVCCVMAYPAALMCRDGRVEQTGRLLFGNVNEEPLPRIWAKPEYARVRRAIREEPNPAACGGCIGLYVEPGGEAQ